MSIFTSGERFVVPTALPSALLANTLFGLHKYDLITFGVTRGYLTQKEEENFFKKRDDQDKKERQKTDAIEAKYIKLYGSDTSKWDASIFEKRDDEIFG